MPFIRHSRRRIVDGTPRLKRLARPVAATKVEGFGWPRAISVQPSAPPKRRQKHPLCFQFIQKTSLRNAEKLQTKNLSASQIDEVNRAFTPTIEEIDYCRRVVQAFDDARARGEGSIAFGGQLLDVPIVDRARQTLALAESLGI